MNRMDPNQKGQVRDAIVNSLAAIRLFSALERTELERIASHMNIFKLAAGDLVFREGDAGDFVCFVIEGTLTVTKQNLSGEDIVIAELRGGRSIGEMAIVDDYPRSATVSAKKQTILVTLTRERFNHLIESNPLLGIKILKGIARLLSLHLRETSTQLLLSHV